MIRSKDVTTKNTVLPPDIVRSQSTVYASQESVYALETVHGTIYQSYDIHGLAGLTVVNEIIYVNQLYGDTIQVLQSHDGTPLWTFHVTGRLCGPPTVANGIVYVSTVEGFVYALHSTHGTRLWLSKVGATLFASPTVIGEMVYVSPAVNPPEEPYVYALHASNGSLHWHARIPVSTSSQLTGVDDVVYAVTHQGCYALHTSDGSLLWQRKLQSDLHSSPIVVDGIVYISLSTRSVDSISHRTEKTRYKVFLCALKASDGTLLWQRQIGASTGANILTAPVAMQGIMYVGADDGYLYALRTSDGISLWHYKTNGTLLSSPTIAEGIVCIGANDGCVYALRSDDGMFLWKTFINVSVSAHASISISTQSSKQEQ